MTSRRLRYSFIERFALAMSAREAGHIAHVKPRLGATLDDGSVTFHHLRSFLLYTSARLGVTSKSSSERRPDT